MNDQQRPQVPKSDLLQRGSFAFALPTQAVQALRVRAEGVQPPVRCPCKPWCVRAGGRAV